MKLRPMSRALLAGALLFAPNLARADLIYETTYLSADPVLLPTSTVLSTSYVTPTSYTSYLTPTVSTSYLTPTSAVVSPDDVLFPTTSYVTTSRRAARRPRRYVERTAYYVAPRYAVAPTSYVLPTTYLAPTSYVTSSILPTSYVLNTGLVPTSASTSSSDCGTLATTPMPTSRAVVPPPATSPASPTERKPSAAVQSSPANGGNEPAPVSTPLPSTAPDTRTTKPAPNSSDAPAPESNQLDQGAGTPPAPPVLPAPGVIQQNGTAPQAGSGDDGVQTRETFKPIYSTPSTTDVRPSNRARNVLRGRVVSFDNGKAEEGVTVYLTSRTGAFTERTTMTDADGRFAVSLPDGDWAVKVRMPSGTVMPVGREDVTASAGRIMDASGRGVQEFVITR